MTKIQTTTNSNYPAAWPDRSHTFTSPPSKHTMRMIPIGLHPEGWTNPPLSLSIMQKNGKQNRYSITGARTTETNSWCTGKAMREPMTLESLSRTSTMPWSLSRNTGKKTTLMNQRQRSPPTTLRPPGNQWRFPLHPVPPPLFQMTSGNPMMTKNMILAALSTTTSPPAMTSFYGTEIWMKLIMRTRKSYGFSD